MIFKVAFVRALLWVFCYSRHWFFMYGLN